MDLAFPSFPSLLQLWHAYLSNHALYIYMVNSFKEQWGRSAVMMSPTHLTCLGSVAAERVIFISQSRS